MTPTIHDELRDRMPDVARGTARWSADDSAHLAACAECRHEWALVQGTARLGVGVERSFDARGANAAIARRLAEAGRRRGSGRAPLWVGVAAAAALAVVLVRPRPVTAPAAPTAVPQAVQLSELDSLSDDELALVADGLDAPIVEAPLVEGQQLNDLDSTDLERVLRSLEG